MAEPGGGPVTTEGWAAIGAGLVTLAGVLARQILKAQLPRRAPAPDPVAGFDRLTEHLQSQVNSLANENRKLRADMDEQERQCAARLDALSDEVARLRTLLARHGITGEATT